MESRGPVGVTAIVSHIKVELSGIAIAGFCKTENMVIEKVAAYIQIQNIRFLILFGVEVQVICGSKY